MAISDVRAALMATFDALGVAVYDHVPPVVSTPALFVFPDEPYLETKLIGSATVRVNVRLRIVAAVASLDNRAALANLEDLLVSVLGNLPSGYVAGEWDKPSMDAVGPSELLVSTMTVETVATLEG